MKIFTHRHPDFYKGFGEVVAIKKIVSAILEQYKVSVDDFMSYEMVVRDGDNYTAEVWVDKVCLFRETSYIKDGDFAKRAYAELEAWNRLLIVIGVSGVYNTKHLTV